jgi:hypothetical protein
MTEEQAENAELKRKLAEIVRGKCAIKDCPNRPDQGFFVGTLCAPCAERNYWAAWSENAALKARLAEAENACPCSGGGHTLTKCPYFRAEAAEKALADHRRDHETTMKVSRGRWREIVQLRKLREAAERERDEWKRVLEKHDEAAKVAIEGWDRWKDRAEAAERKCAEMSERLAMADRLISYAACVKPTANTDEWAAGLEQRCNAYMTKYAADGWAFAALASQPAPEGKPCRIDEFGGCSAHPDCPPIPALSEPKPEPSAEAP